MLQKCSCFRISNRLEVLMSFLFHCLGLILLVGFWDSMDPECIFRPAQGPMPFYKASDWRELASLAK
jgi:hypothetical protein